MLKYIFIVVFPFLISGCVSKEEFVKLQNQLNSLKVEKAQAERQAAKAERKAKAERLAKLEAERQAEAERLAKLEAKRKAEEALKRAEAERLAKLEAEKKAEEAKQKATELKKKLVVGSNTEVYKNEEKIDWDNIDPADIETGTYISGRAINRLRKEKEKNFDEMEAILKLDTKGHVSKITDIIVTDDGEIISASDDKTIRVWDIETGKEKRKILGQIGAGAEGLIYAIALSPDKKYLAVGGFLGKFGGEGKNVGRIRIYNYQTGELEKILYGHEDAINDLSFSLDGKYLISGSADKTAKIWNVKNNFRLVDTINFHSKQVYAVKIIKKRNRYFAITAGDDNKIEIYDMQQKKTIKSHQLNYKLQYLATTKNRIATCGFGKEIKIYDWNLNPIKTIYSENEPSGLKYSKNGKYLIAGAGALPLNINIYETKNYQLYSSLKKFNNLVQAVDFWEKDNKIYGVAGGGDNNKILVWNIDNSKIKTKIAGVGQRVWSVGISGNKIAWGNKWTARLGKSKLQKFIDISNFKIQDINNNLNFKRISTKNGIWSLKHSAGGDYGYSDAVLEIRKNGKIETKIIKDSTTGLRHRCYGWYKDLIISGGSNGQLKVYNRNGVEVASLIGHTGEIWSIALDGDILVSGSDDQTIKLWNLKELSKLAKMVDDLTVAANEAVNSQDQEQLAKIVIAAMILQEMQKIKPMLNIFVSKNNEYVVWTEEGYFVSSEKGGELVGFHINQGDNFKSTFIQSSQMAKIMYRPDVIKYTWETGSEEQGIKLASKKQHIQKWDLKKMLPPKLVMFQEFPGKTGKKMVKIDYKVLSADPNYELIVYLNGRLLQPDSFVTKKGKISGESTKSIVFELEPGKNYISLKVKNSFGISSPLEYTIKRVVTGPVPEDNPNLYLLAVGIKDYQDPSINPLLSADKDAKDIAKLFKKQEGVFYKKVNIKLLTDREATTYNIINGLKWLKENVTKNDIAMIFIAGHGANDEKNNYNFISYDTEIADSESSIQEEGIKLINSVKFDEFQKVILKLPSRVVLMADTCFSGNIFSANNNFSSATMKMKNSGAGAVILAASTSSGFSYSGRTNGYFTRAILEAFKNKKTDYDGDGFISDLELSQFINLKVQDYSGGDQQPVLIAPSGIPQFAIGSLLK